MELRAGTEGELLLCAELILCRPASTAASPDGARVSVLLPLLDRSRHPLFADTVLCEWAGAEAEAFYREHQGALRAGRGVRVLIERLEKGEHHIRARVRQAELMDLPPSWIAHAARQAQEAEQRGTTNPLHSAPALAQ